ncbi:hypothetical protein Ddye_002730 [Dipteronia dyeriana]|uniref:Uncharacterized protein n=1 Tax=Dipteronia dyeriana TaxID=168575 RepID=A0AAD9XQT5_9ROSI|nr:hypothetical protein Ddye_002730 [Dipteronia dyeriana]
MKPSVRDEKKRVIVASPVSSARRRRTKKHFPSRIHPMKTRSGTRGIDISVLEEELTIRIARGKDNNKG